MTRFRLLTITIALVSSLLVNLSPASVYAQNAGVGKPMALKLVINQYQHLLTLKDIGFEEVYPSDYKLELVSDFYTVKIIHPNRDILFSGKVANKIILYGEGEPIEKIPQQLVLYLPDFQEAERIVFYDEAGNLKLTIYLKDYDLKLLPTPTVIIPTTLPISGQPTCDLCGLCNGGDKPKDWESCHTCVSQANRVWTSLGCIPINPASFIERILQFVIGIAGGIVFLALVYGSMTIMTSKGDKDRLRSGKQIIISSLIALSLIIFSLVILSHIGISLFSLPGFGR